ncbi:PAS domain S-box-containing protein/diguanylate cyclase (GGDEF) domain-containing protein [Caldanaerovirga acetigignens]|uniref:PAS domain S-box-containing protein/diguanylate cyclase (GGDEF) domain-containing protein n=1 Tax=Caldanaerovirga acetigignens TaxID=447595 RepID=A0A1M7MER0_9FIRM|nr:HD domain-containing phosphohydrolase [Caldanaerovirga acetigignens]SHM89328.1 PAS domain S-box-containing protein/diguanylate cyclase (GGDEF) domain-containing protein [Caldanaerovirga acetigignens]
MDPRVLSFDVIFNATQDAMFIVEVDDNGTFRYLANNAAHQRLAGYSINDIQGKRPEEVLGEELGKIVASGYRKALEAGEPVEYEETLPFPAGVRTWQVRITPVFVNGKVRYLVGARKDITMQKKAERERESHLKELLKEKELLKITLLSIGDGVVTTDNCGKITSVNRAAEEITGWKAEEVMGKPFNEVFQLFSEKSGKKVMDPVSKVLKKGKIVGLANHTALLTKNGRKISIADSASPIVNEKGDIYGVVVIFRDITKERAMQQKMLDLSYRDFLTGLYNRRYVEEKISQLEKENIVPVSIIMADVNGLKLANDVFGHLEGDFILKKASFVLKKGLRPGGIAARWGGDEFLVVLPNADEQFCRKFVNKIRLRCKNANSPDNDQKFQLNLALGYAVKKKSNENLRKLIQEAEEMMYKNKMAEGRSFRHAVIKALLSTLSAKSMETEEHALRIKDLCLAIGVKLGLSAAELDELSLFAMLHDIGKVGIPEHILLKPGPLSQEEWEVMKRHPEIGFRIAQNTSDLVSIAKYILHHHERWDGKGYPMGLKGKEIPLLCRILAVADAYDAMTSERPYRSPMTKDTALLEIRNNSGSQFDPKVVELFLEIMQHEDN